MKKFKLSQTLVLILALFPLFFSCSSNKKSNNSYVHKSKEANNHKDSPLNLNGQSDEYTAGPMQTIYFPYDSSRLNAESEEKLRVSANFLKENSSVQILIEGHCDEKGSVQYNLALGERRAKSVKAYLVALGVSQARIETISLGKEKPIAYGHNQTAWAKNRRGNFVVTAK